MSSLVFVALAAMALRSSTFWNVAVAVVYVIVAMAIVGVFPFRIRLLASSERIHIRNVFRSHSITRSDIERIESSYDGMVFYTVDGHRHLAVAAPKWNIARVLRRETRADRVAAMILSGRPSD